MRKSDEASKFMDKEFRVVLMEGLRVVDVNVAPLLPR